MAPSEKRGRGWATTLDYLMGVPEFAARFQRLPMPEWRYDKGYNLLGEIALFLSALWGGLTYRGLLLYTGRGYFKPELLAAFVLSFVPSRFRAIVVFCGEAWQPDTGWRYLLERLIVARADRVVSFYALISRDECRLFARAWRVDPEKICFVPYMYSFTERDLEGSVPEGDYIFAGGNSFRNYEPLVEAARSMPDHQFIIATRKLDGRADLPPNVRAGQVPSAEFLRLMRGAAVVVVPLRTDTMRASGQQTYLNSMWLRRVTIVNDAVGVRDYVRHRENGLVVDGTPESYVAALRWAFDPANAARLRGIVSTAYDDVNRVYNRRHHASMLVSLMEQAIAKQPGPSMLPTA